MPPPQCEALASPGLPAPGVEAEGCVDIRHVQWLTGKLRLRWRNLMAGQQEQCALLGKVVPLLQRLSAAQACPAPQFRMGLAFGWMWVFPGLAGD